MTSASKLLRSLPIVMENGKFKLANLVTLSRLVLIVPIMLLLSSGLHDLALWLYIAAVLTDLVDGWLARREKSSSAFGAQLDGVVDNIFSASILFFLLMAFPETLSRHVLWVSALFGSPILYLGLSYCFTRKFMMYHFTSARLGAFLLFCLWPVLTWWNCDAFLLVAASVITSSRIEQLVYMARGGTNLQAAHCFAQVDS